MERGEQRTIKFDWRNLGLEINLRQLVDVLDKLTSKIEFDFGQFKEAEKSTFLKVVELSQGKISSMRFLNDDEELFGSYKLFSDTMNKLIKSRFNLDKLEILNNEFDLLYFENSSSTCRKFFDCFDGIKFKKLVQFEEPGMNIQPMQDVEATNELEFH